MTTALQPIAPNTPPTTRRMPKPTLLIGLLMLLVLLTAAFVPRLLAPYSPTDFDYNAILQPPNATHPFGTDNFGRDVLSRVIHGTRIDLQIALFTTMFPFIFGSLLGALTGFLGRWSDALVGRIADIVVVFPFLVLVIAIVAVLGPGLTNMYIAVSAVGWVTYWRLVRGEVLAQKKAEYAQAARVLGYSPTRVLLRHIFPNAVTPAVVYLMTDMSLGILLGASLGYLGLGAQPPTPEWGVMVADGKNFMATAWWISTFPGLALTFAGVTFSLIGDGLADALRPRA
ncbi:ABC-type dipeptide/oligopeptide/nickel transport system, permease component (plasmid) [Deinococcus peraridilitoris DSM 19664]|uniref:ABC-type dipeptide/oligopeptide/nickel transport system, permease component n=2 Tax=Deinococcus TaxID=1298 RepID=L0A9F6_DEIPD|nr:ABC transporter permease [Deinococcus peraridilitoris]AFZ69675.1 ABC-type dipeptide/oligopeptide/nickel transport system, permease component [Deinococcus peraridilitoris DSM 19664]